MNTHELGTIGQTLAKEYLEKRGYVYVGEHFTGTRGEIDLIMREGDQLVFVEVKTRTGHRVSTPFDSITRAKKEKLYFTALEYLEKHHINTDNFRIDGVGVTIVGTDVSVRQWRGIR